MKTNNKTIADKLNAGVSMFILCGLAYWKVWEYVPTGGLMGAALALIPIGYLVVDIYMGCRKS